MINPAKQSSQFSQPEALLTVTTTAALVIASGADDLISGAHAETRPWSMCPTALDPASGRVARGGLCRSAVVPTPTPDTIEALAVSLGVSKALMYALKTKPEQPS
jgi:hypothetical protein